MWVLNALQEEMSAATQPGANKRETETDRSRFQIPA